MTKHERGAHAVVLGAGMAGLLAARVLSDRYRTVTLIERDQLPDSPIQRRGIPQGHHLHALLSRGSQVLEQLFPGLLDELVAAGAQVIDDGDHSRVYTRIGPYGVNRRRKFTDPSALVTYQATRPLLEYLLRQRVGALAGVRLLDGHDVVAPTAPTPERITGVLVVDRTTGVSTVLEADVVVDAMGRTARTPALLDDLGYGRPPELRAPVRGAYFSQFVTLPDTELSEKLVLVRPGPGNRIGGLIAYEHDTWVLTLGAEEGEVPPVGLDGMLALAEQSIPTHVLVALRPARPLSDVAVFRHSGARWRRYDQMSRLPNGLLVIGDALCTLNPTHGQGITVAAQQALALRDALAGPEHELPRRFFRAAADVIGPTWAMNRSGQHRAPAPTSSPRSLSTRLRNWTTTRAMRAAEHDIVLTERMLRVSHLVDPPARLQDPALLGRVLVSSLRRA